jgi:hypothetical protein
VREIGRRIVAREGDVSWCLFVCFYTILYMLFV